MKERELWEVFKEIPVEHELGGEGATAAQDGQASERPSAIADVGVTPRDHAQIGGTPFAQTPLFDADEALDMLEHRQYVALRTATSHLCAPDISEIMQALPARYHTRFFRLLSKEQAAQTFVELSPDIQQTIVQSYNDRELSEMLNEIYLDDTVDLIEEMPANVVRRIIAASAPEDRAVIRQLLGYPKNSAGSVMTTEYVRFRKTMTTEEALAHIRQVAIDKETIYTCYVTEEDRTLCGIVTAKALLLASGDTRLCDLMEEDIICAHTEDDREDVADKFEKYGFLALPVVDREKRLVGIITVDDAMDVLRQEREEDFAKMAAMAPTEEAYLKTKVSSLWKSRIPWLMILMISATFSSMILNVFETALPAVLILFVPMLMDTGGNSGAQTSVTVIRALSLGEITYADVGRVLIKEVCVGLLCGASLSLVAFAKVLLVDHFLMQNPAVTVAVAVAVSLSMFVSIVAAKSIGSLLPMLAGRLGFDPAVLASPFITTLVDALALVLYFVISKALLPL